MKTEEGWVRGHLCGKSVNSTGYRYSCALCYRSSDHKINLCYPAAPERKPIKPKEYANLNTKLVG